MGKTSAKVSDRVVFEGGGGKESFFVYVEPDMVDKWRKDKSIPLVEVVQAFTIFEVDNGGNHGIAIKPSKSSLHAFGTEDETVIVTRILNDGRLVHGHQGPASSKGYVQAMR
ncbi:hypothetical protein BATDEDRAFT_89467 [Batrachochytrium dendrobatidis JAM81]|uniref:Ribosome maturation protein SDO1/SBDS N-terminal domain-containing protein n=1 Tax=Batrachochytrium dendrobatidis (strain JAM81 / FGSC 10211) TaxID=684364 RepID=F4P563_BATDJ|nr:uncharacterized protein BATDEDRAFT_89467 [Batrachochytrium dendrobatidis JAM81]EGF79815.1 hypothetical protein BATDEDRAFT_89467 [Batrachochytrium dendrobatidis JAM81]|eukprot:XP_006679690.1 hypothetical protein BATDEDRAFT_89467 [Batrachochytrium dendrobatidis JAM81]